jgi:hypothetical protein
MVESPGTWQTGWYPPSLPTVVEYEEKEHDAGVKERTAVLNERVTAQFSTMIVK